MCCQPYIQYMRFARRAEGIKAARAVFKMAREDTRTTYQLYVAAALMEYYCSKVITMTLPAFSLPPHFLRDCRFFPMIYVFAWFIASPVQTVMLSVSDIRSASLLLIRLCTACLDVVD